MENKKKQMIISVLGVILLLVIVGGISYAMYTFTGTGSKENVITSGSVSIDYAEATNITLTNQYPESDALGINSTDPSSEMEFTVSSNVTGTQTINYAIGFDAITEGRTLTGDYVKVYLTKGNNVATNFTINEGRTINSFRTSYVEGLIESYAILTDTFSNTESHTYKLKAWVSETYVLPTNDTSSGNTHSNTSTSEEFKFKIKVVATDSAVAIAQDTVQPVLTTANIYLVNENVSYKEQTNKTILLANSNRELITNQALNTNDEIEVELVYSKTLSGVAPTLELKFGTEKATGTISNGVITDNKVTYSYTIQTNDKGTIKIDKLTGDKLTDIRGNKAAVTISEEINNSIANITTMIPNLDTSGASEPDLAVGMIPVYYDSTNDTWRKADANNADSSHRWYSYTSDNSDTTKGMWANAVTVSETNRAMYMNAPLGTAISMDDINTMWVWIPRFNATTPSGYNGGTQTAPGAIDVTFVDINTPSIDAFWWDEDSDGVEDTGEQKSGFWFGKFENSATSIPTAKDNTPHTIIIKPNVTSWRYSNVSTFFTSARNMENTGNIYGFNSTIDTLLDTHMVKNNEWGAVVYLAQSIYGRCTSSVSCTEIGINNKYPYTTGYGAPAESSSSVTNGSYATSLGKNASTTGTIYGIYDMSGNAGEYVMGNYNNYSGYDSTHNSGFNGSYGSGGSLTTGIAFPESKYYNLYTGAIYTGHALTETTSWYSDNAYFVNSNYPWFKRGGSFNGSSNSGVFYFGDSNGDGSSSNSFRLSIVK